MNEHEIYTAFMDAFTVEKLEQMLRLELGLALENISTGGDKEAIVSRLVRTAIREGWLTGLINAAYASNPGNEKLQALMRSARMPGRRNRPMMEFDLYTPSQNQPIPDRVTELEFTVYGNRGSKGVLASLQSLDARLSHIETLLATRHNTPIGPWAAQVLLILIALLTFLAAAEPTWVLILSVWRWFGGGI